MENFLEGMTETEHAFFERMKDAPQEQRDHFRTALNMLMTCYGLRPDGGLVAFYIDRRQAAETGSATLTVTSINLSPDETLYVAEKGLLTIYENLKQDDTHAAPSTVQ